MADDCVLRELREDDRPFVAKSWLESFAGSHDAGPIPMHLYRPVYRAAIAWLIGRSDSKTIVACSAENDSLILGWSCGGNTSRHGKVLHYVFVKSWYRRRGIATSLIAALGLAPAEPFIYTYRTPLWRELRNSRSWGRGKWNPLAARFRTEDPYVPSVPDLPDQANPGR